MTDTLAMRAARRRERVEALRHEADEKPKPQAEKYVSVHLPAERADKLLADMGWTRPEGGGWTSPDGRHFWSTDEALTVALGGF